MKKLLITPSFILNNENSNNLIRTLYVNIYGFKPIAIHLMPVFQHISNPKKAEGVQHNATLK